MGFYQNLLHSKTRIAISNFLNIELVNKGIWFFNIWSIVHFIVGGLFMWLLIAVGLKPGTRWIVFVSVIIIYELFELIMSATTQLFVFEPVKDILWDIIIAILAGGIVELIFWIRSMVI